MLSYFVWILVVRGAAGTGKTTMSTTTATMRDSNQQTLSYMCQNCATNLNLNSATSAGGGEVPGKPQSLVINVIH